MSAESNTPSVLPWVAELRGMGSDVPLWDEMVDVVEEAWRGTAHHDLSEDETVCPLCIFLFALKRQVPSGT